MTLRVLLCITWATPTAIRGSKTAPSTSTARALATPGHDIPGLTLNNLGTAHAKKGDYDRAIDFYRQALATPGYDTPGDTLQNLGLAHTNKGEYDRAFDFYHKALATPGYDTPGLTLNNLGIAHAKKGDYDRAIDFYRQALATPGYDTPQKARVNLANALRLSKRTSEALATIDQVLAEPDREGQHERANSVRGLILADLARIKTTPEDESLASVGSRGNDRDGTPEARIARKLQGLEDKYKAYLARKPSERSDTFSVLRGWSSAITLLEGSREGHWRGGGYFLKWAGRGIVIDPGFDFLDNFHDAGFHAVELDAVLVSHNHADHNYDLGSLDDLHYEIYRRKLTKNPDGSWHPDLSKALFVIDPDTAKAFPDTSPDHRGRAMQFQPFDYERRRWIEKEQGLPISIEHFPVQHGDDVPHAVGMRLKLHADGQPDLILGYTGDTRYFEGLSNHLKGCDILLAHISQPDNQELEDPNHEKRFHLGYNGVTKLVRETKPRLTLIGEFWAGLADLRIDLIQGLRRRTGTDAILPTGLGFHLRLPSLEVECTECKAPTPYSEVRIAPSTIPFGPLGYLCKKCFM